jgi:hypothetical protein
MKPAIVFVWANLGPYHIDRLEAAAEALKDTHRVVGIELAGTSQTYLWARAEEVSGFERITLIPDRQSDMPPWRLFIALARVCLKTEAHHVFLWRTMCFCVTTSNSESAGPLICCVFWVVEPTP